MRSFLAYLVFNHKYKSRNSDKDQLEKEKKGFKKVLKRFLKFQKKKKMQFRFNFFFLEAKEKNNRKKTLS
jgi:hypothetical protein